MADEVESCIWRLVHLARLLDLLHPGSLSLSLSRIIYFLLILVYFESRCLINFLIFEEINFLGLCGMRFFGLLGGGDWGF